MLLVSMMNYRLSQKKWHGSVDSAHSILNSLGLTHCALLTVLDSSLAAIAHYRRVETKTTKNDTTLALSYRSGVISSGTICMCSGKRISIATCVVTKAMFICQLILAFVDGWYAGGISKDNRPYNLIAQWITNTSDSMERFERQWHKRYVYVCCVIWDQSLIVGQWPVHVQEYSVRHPVLNVIDEALVYSPDSLDYGSEGALNFRFPNNQQPRINWA